MNGRVVITDPSWNPASDLQAIDRAYRLGSKRDVSVYRLISAGTLEEIVYSRQIYKQQQSNVAIENAKEPRYFEGKQPLPSLISNTSYTKTYLSFTICKAGFPAMFQGSYI